MKEAQGSIGRVSLVVMWFLQEDLLLGRKNLSKTRLPLRLTLKQQRRRGKERNVQTLAEYKTHNGIFRRKVLNLDGCGCPPPHLPYRSQ